MGQEVLINADEIERVMQTCMGKSKCLLPIII